MHKISLKDWVVLLTIIPTTLIGLGVAGYFSYSRYVELEEFLTLRSQSIIEPIAIASADPIINKDREKLRHLIGFAHRSHANIVKSIAVFTKDNQIFVTSAYHGDTNVMRIKAGKNIPQNTHLEKLDNYLIFRTPIIDESHQVKNLEELKGNPTIVGYIAMQIDRDKIKYRQQSQFLIAFSIVIFGSLLSAIFAFQLIKNVTRPVTSMVNAVDRIREGKLESRVSGQLIGELNFLKNGINAMAQSLGDYHDEMQRSIDQATIDLRESLEQFEIQNVELDISKRKAQDANRVKSEFLANMSHELRTPLNGVIGFTRQVLKTPLSETQRDYLQTIERSANSLLAIINDILDFSKLDADKMIIENIPFSLRDSVEETLTLLAPIAHQKNLELSLRIAQQLPDFLIGDAMRIKQVIINLANNAIKFTEKGLVSIDIDSEHIDEKLAVFKITVTDTGIGMNSEQQKSIFEAFGQADKSITRLYGGTGLGLVISQRLAREMHGDIGFITEENRGSTFWFSFQCEVNPLPMTSMLNTKALADKNILYYEPITHSRMATSEILASWKMKVTPVTSLEQFSNALAQNNCYDFALIGHDVTPSALTDLKKLIASVKPQISAIHLAINSNSPNLQEALIANGAVSCLSKPITPSRLCKVLLPQPAHGVKLLPEVVSKKIPIKVLAVDDNDANLKLIKALLLEQVSEVITASNGQEAVTLCQNEKFALIFMDIQMPVMDGVTALKAIRSNTFNEDTAIIAVTAHALSSEKEKLLVEGFDSYITKPLDETMLRHTLYEYGNLELFAPRPDEASSDDKLSQDSDILPRAETTPEVIDVISPEPVQAEANPYDFGSIEVINWSLALQRTGNNSELAKEMLDGLLQSLPETKVNIEYALNNQDTERLKTLIHKLNGACCYTGVPNLGKITHQIETALKNGENAEALEPEFFEFFEHLDKVLHQAPQTLKILSES
ncbi:two-component sensor histidine kinase BarA [Thalassomonas actiniarum]|uniref:histidine kinase n=1 Tax=Thalassomonas actiniarum TaxID=485447 RepID=A0AAE9YV19_9GAMM|nr:two-component sensor histidine kinase BarA [Thalassomonas actiniarum]WDE00038.1 two-component sensor histidine kinase BarA [Thalassomonas actiniarum]